MKGTYTIVLLPLLPFANTLVEPQPVAELPAEIPHIEKRAVTCALTGSNVKYHRGPSTSSIADGEFEEKGTKVSFSCYTFGSNVNGDM